jgi:hypothetical protein
MRMLRIKERVDTFERVQTLELESLAILNKG